MAMDGLRAGLPGGARWGIKGPLQSGGGLATGGRELSVALIDGLKAPTAVRGGNSQRKGKEGIGFPDASPPFGPTDSSPERRKLLQVSSEGGGKGWRILRLSDTNKQYCNYEWPR